jgi:hypothetical protein
VFGDDGPWPVACDREAFVRLAGRTQVWTAPFHPRSNAKIGRWREAVEGDATRPAPPQPREEAERIVADFVGHHEAVRMRGAVGYVTPHDMLAGPRTEIDRAPEDAVSSPGSRGTLPNLRHPSNHEVAFTPDEHARRTAHPARPRRTRAASRGRDPAEAGPRRLPRRGL